MSSNKQDQAARRRATQDVIAANRPLFEERMRHYYEEMGLGTWTPRLSPEERAAAKAEAAKQAAADKIKALAEAAGIGVLLVDDAQIAEKIQAVHDGTSEGVEVDWKDKSDEALEAEEDRIMAEVNEQATTESNLERAARISAEAEAYEEDRQRREDEEADAAEAAAQVAPF